MTHNARFTATTQADAGPERTLRFSASPHQAQGVCFVCECFLHSEVAFGSNRGEGRRCGSKRGERLRCNQGQGQSDGAPPTGA